MVKYCVAYGCKTLEQKGSGIQFHSFPFKRTVILKKWIHAIRRENWTPTSSSRICSLHFKECDYLIRPGAAVRRLKSEAVPSVFSFPNHLLKTQKDRRVIIRQLPADTSNTNIHDKQQEDKEGMEINQLSSMCHNMVDKATQTEQICCSPQKDKLRKKVKTLQQRIRRRNYKIKTMRDLIVDLKRNKLGSTALVSVLENNFSGFPLEFMVNQAKNAARNSNHKRYTTEMKQFSLTLYFYSPKAFRFLREKFHLPNARTIRKWMSSYNCDAGFLHEVFEFLKGEVENKPYLKDCALILDAMSIRKQILWDKKNDKHVGYVDYGGIVDVDPETIATEALVFQIVSYREKFKCPIAYFLTNKSSGQIQCQLIKVAISKLYEIGITVRSITADGTLANLHTFKQLGCTLESYNLKPYFKHPSGETNVYVMLDACHMLKLVRNAMGEQNITSLDGSISWKYIYELHRIQEECDFKLANSLTGAHVAYQNKKMNARLAAQVLSSGVADAIDYLRSTGANNFQNSEATVKFLRIIDRIFDMLNSKNPFEKGYKAALRLSNITYYSEIFKETEEYLKALKINDILLLQHRRKTFALGLMVTMNSTINLASDLLTKSDPLKYFLTYKCSQDNIEIFFTLVRSSGGWNNNPNVLQFKWALRKLLFKNSAKPVVTANCVDLTYQVNPVFAFRSEKRSTCKSTTTKADDNINFDLCSLLDSINLSGLQNNILYYISGAIIRKILSSNSCIDCNKILLNKQILQNDHTYSAAEDSCQGFTKHVNRKNLLFVSEVVHKICQHSEKLYQIQVKSNIRMCNFKGRIVHEVVKEFSQKLHLFKPTHPISGEYLIEDLHEVQLIKKIASSYPEMRIKTRAKTISERIQGSGASIRQKLNHLVLFNNV